MSAKAKRLISRIMCIFSACVIMVSAFILPIDTYRADDEYKYDFNGSITAEHFNLTYGQWSNFANTYGFNGEYSLSLWDASFDHVNENYRFSLTFDAGEIIARKGQSLQFCSDFRLECQDYGESVHEKYGHVEVHACNPQGEWKFLGYAELSGKGTVHIIYNHGILREDVRMIKVHVYCNIFGVYDYDGSHDMSIAHPIYFRNPSYVTISGRTIPLTNESNKLNGTIDDLGDLDKPEIDDLPDLNLYLDNDIYLYFMSLMSDITNMKVCVGGLIIVCSVAFVSYVLFGKKG